MERYKAGRRLIEEGLAIETQTMLDGRGEGRERQYQIVENTNNNNKNSAEWQELGIATTVVFSTEYTLLLLFSHSCQFYCYYVLLFFLWRFYFFSFARIQTTSTTRAVQQQWLPGIWIVDTDKRNPTKVLTQFYLLLCAKVYSFVYCAGFWFRSCFCSGFWSLAGCSLVVLIFFTRFYYGCLCQQTWMRCDSTPLPLQYTIEYLSVCLFICC